MVFRNNHYTYFLCLWVQLRPGMTLRKNKNVQLRKMNFMFWSEQRPCFSHSHREFAASFPRLCVSRDLSSLFMLEKEGNSGPLVRLIPMIHQVLRHCPHWVCELTKTPADYFVLYSTATEQGAFQSFRHSRKYRRLLIEILKLIQCSNTLFKLEF